VKAGDTDIRSLRKGSGEDMKILARLAMLMMFGPTLAHAGAPPMSGYMNCARAMGVAINDKFAVIPGERSGDKGLFVYTDRSAYFLPLGAPGIEEREAQEFLLRTEVSGVGEIFLSFREKKQGSKSDIQSGIGYQTTLPPKKVLDSYRVTPANDSLGEQARVVLRKRLKEKIASVKDFIDEKNSFGTPGEAKVAFEKDRVVYRTKLESCNLDGDSDLKLVVAEEMQKLESGLPGATIWEIQIGGRPTAAQARQKVSSIY
jgi:hypothetical protein